MRSPTKLHTGQVNTEPDWGGPGLGEKAALVSRGACIERILIADVLRLGALLLFPGCGVSRPAGEDGVVLTARVRRAAGGIASVP